MSDNATSQDKQVLKEEIALGTKLRQQLNGKANSLKVFFACASFSLLSSFPAILEVKVHPDTKGTAEFVKENPIATGSMIMAAFAIVSACVAGGYSNAADKTRVKYKAAGDKLKA